MTATNLPALLQSFFVDRLLTQRRASPNTIASYRDTFRLLLRFASSRLRKAPSKLSLDDLDAPFIAEFLTHLEEERGNGPRTRNNRQAAIHSFFRFVALNEPAHALLCQRVLAMPSKRHERKPVAFLNREEIDALLAAPDASTWVGHRDKVMLTVAVQTGLRVSELIGLKKRDFSAGSGAHVRCQGKGRKHRCTPLRAESTRLIERWLKEVPADDDTPLFPSVRRRHLSRDAVERLVANHARRAGQACPSLKRVRVTPHMLRHTAAMELLRHGVDRSVIALWLGHESIETTEIYLHASLEMKSEALARTTPFDVAPGRYRADDELLQFLEQL